MVSQNSAGQKMQRRGRGWRWGRSCALFSITLMKHLDDRGKKQPSGPRSLFWLLQDTSQTSDSSGNLQVFQSWRIAFFSSHPVCLMPPTTKFAKPKNDHKKGPKMSRSSTRLSPTELCHRHIISFQIHLCTNMHNVFNHHFLNHITGYHQKWSDFFFKWVL